MDLVDRVDADLKSAMKARQEGRLSTLRLLKAAFVTVAIDQQQERVTEPQALHVIRRQIKQRRESLEAFQKGQRADLVEKESAELAILQTYLPPQLAEAALRGIVQECVTASGASGPRDMGKVMKLVIERVQGQADGKTISQLVTQALAQKA